MHFVEQSCAQQGITFHSVRNKGKIKTCFKFPLLFLVSCLLSLAHSCVCAVAATNNEVCLKCSFTRKNEQKKINEEEETTSWCEWEKSWCNALFDPYIYFSSVFLGSHRWFTSFNRTFACVIFMSSTNALDMLLADSGEIR